MHGKLVQQRARAILRLIYMYSTRVIMVVFKQLLKHDYLNLKLVVKMSK